MDYIITVIGGVIFGFLLPPQIRVIVATILLAVGLLLVSVLLAISSSYDAQTIVNLFLMVDTPELTRPGLIQLVGVGYAASIGGLVVAVKFLFFRTKS